MGAEQMQQRVSTSRERQIAAELITVVRNSRFSGHFAASSLRIRIQHSPLARRWAGTAFGHRCG